MGRTVVIGRTSIVTSVLGVGSAKPVEPGIRPAALSSEVTSKAWWLALCMTQTLDLAGADLWCIGQVASAPCVHVQAAPCPSGFIENAIGTSATVPSWHESQTAAITPKNWRQRVMSNSQYPA